MHYGLDSIRFCSSVFQVSFDQYVYVAVLVFDYSARTEQKYMYTVVFVLANKRFDNAKWKI